MSRAEKPIRRTSRRKPLARVRAEHVCANCGNGFSGTYCNRCGQHFDTKRLTTRELWDNIAFSFINFDRGIPNTMRRLFSNPGRMIREYILGHRVNYSHPMAMLILLCTVYGIAIALAGAAVAPGDAASAGSEITGLGKNLTETASGGALVRVLKHFFGIIARSTIFQAVLPVPFFALAARRLFRRYGSREYNYAEMLFACLYMASQRMAVAIVLGPLIVAYPDAEWLPVLKAFLYVALAAWTFRDMFGTGWRKSLWKSVLMFLFGWTLLGAAVVVLAAVAVLIFVLVRVTASLFSAGGFQGLKNILDTNIIGV